MFEPFLIVVFESLSCPPCEKISKSFSHCCKGFKYAKDGGKLKTFWDLEIFSEEQSSV